MNTRLEKALNDFRNELIEITKEELNKNGGIKGIRLELPCSIDEERYHTVMLNCVYLEDDEVWTRGMDDLYGEVENRLILHSCDDIIAIIQAM